MSICAYVCIYTHIQCHVSAKLTKLSFERKIWEFRRSCAQLAPAAASIQAAKCEFAGPLCRSLCYAKFGEKHSYFLIISEEVY